MLNTGSTVSTVITILSDMGTTAKCITNLSTSIYFFISIKGIKLFIYWNIWMRVKRREQNNNSVLNSGMDYRLLVQYLSEKGWIQ